VLGVCCGGCQVAAALDSPLPPLWRSAYQNLSGALSAGGCRQGSEIPQIVPADLDGAAATAWAAAGRAACTLGCQEHEVGLAEAFEPWWDHQMPQQAILSACDQVGGRYSLAFLGAIVEGRVFWSCCSSPGDGCEASDFELDSAQITDRDAFLTVVAELAEAGLLPDMYFLFNTGDQPFTDKTYWSPVPQFHWVKSAGHWTITLPNPFHLKAHFSDLLGDSKEHTKHFVPWDKKIAKVFWRGSLSAPDHLIVEDIATLPRLRLLHIASQSPELFDVGITGIDSEMKRAMGAKAFASLVRQTKTVKHVSMQRTLPKYRYVINVSAVLSAWRLVELLASGSLLLLQDDPSSELIYEWLTPWKHFVPISHGLSDLVEKVRWLEEHQAEAEAIARRGFEHFVKRMRRQDTYCYIWQALSGLARSTVNTSLPKVATLKKNKWTEINMQANIEASHAYVPLRDLLSASPVKSPGDAEL